MSRCVALLACLLFAGQILPGAAEPASGKQFEDSRLGLRFRAPEGWIGQQSSAGFLLGSNTVPGMILVLPHTFGNLAQMRREAAEGWIDQSEQIHLPATGPVVDVGANRIAVELAGIVQGQRVKAHLVGLMSPSGGGILILAATDPSNYGARYAQLTGQIADSAQFSKPGTVQSAVAKAEAPRPGATKSEAAKPPATKDAGIWTERFSGQCVAYMRSSSSGGSSYSGWSEKRFLYLFEDGSFQAVGSFSGSFDTSAGFGSFGNGPQRQAGKWNVTDQGGQSHLVLTHSGAEKESFTLSRQGTQTFLNGRRWFVISHQECNR